jgi:NAD(P)-dependent dehydrogenase (short-subunit alcohol dehydrogenase family)
MDFSGKTAVVTGGANGIGRQIVQDFMKAGAQVAVIDIDKEPVDCSLYFCGDIAVEKDLIDFTDQVIMRYGAIDYLINNACISRGGILSNCTYDDFVYVQKVGVAAPYMLAKLFIDHFNKNGAIVNISSTRAYMSQADTESYTSAKGGITALTHALAVSLAGRVRVNSISPGWIDTKNSDHSRADKEQHPAKRIGRTSDISSAVMFLCSEENGFITGENITIDGGMSRLMIYNDDGGWRYG